MLLLILSALKRDDVVEVVVQAEVCQRGCSAFQI